MDLQNTRHQAENALVSAIFYLPKHQGEIFSGIKPKYFESEKLGRIFEVAKSVYDEGEPVNLVTLRGAFVEQDGAVPTWLSVDVTEGDVTILPHDIDSIKRAIIKEHMFATFAVGSARATTVEEARNVAIELLDSVTALDFEDDPPISQACESFVKKQHEIKEQRLEYGYPLTGGRLDEHIRLSPGGLYVIGGIKKGGKTQLGLSILDLNLQKNVPCLMFSIEMSVEQVLRKLTAHHTGIDSKKILTRHINDNELGQITAAAGDISGLPLHINQRAEISPAEIAAKTRTWAYKNEIERGTGIVLVDFLQLIRAEANKNESDATTLRKVAYSLARIAKQMKVAVVAIVQFRNEAEGQKPDLRFIEGSGGIAQAAEAIILVDHVRRRDKELERAKIEEFNIIIDAQRHGESGVIVPMMADLSTSTFTDKVDMPF
jgi:replicative DNA helicase